MICGFENDGMCGWTQDVSDQFDWSKGTGNTTSVYTGPKWDRTYETGFGKFFLYKIAMLEITSYISKSHSDV